MNDSVFNTLAAVAMMCYGHFHGSFSNDLVPLNGTYDAGFEQCAVISKELEAERARRAKAATAVKAEADKARVANAMAALLGRPFAPEPAPGPPQPGSLCQSVLEPGTVVVCQ